MILTLGSLYLATKYRNSAYETNTETNPENLSTIPTQKPPVESLYPKDAEKPEEKIEEIGNNMQVGGWIPAFGFSEGLETVTTNPGKLFHVDYAGLSVDEYGNLIYSANFPGEISKLNEEIESFGINFLATPYQNTSGFLNNRAKWDEFINLVKDIKRDNENFTGITLNFEEIYTSDGENFYEFVDLINTEKESLGIKLYISVYAKFADDPFPTVTKNIHDYTRLGQVADFVIIQCYDYIHLYNAFPGPLESNSAPEWVDKVSSYAVSTIPVEKVIIALPAYGYAMRKDTAVTQLTGASYPNRAKYLINENQPEILYDELFGDKYFDIGEERFYFQDKETIDNRKEIIKKYGINKVYFWKVGGDEGEIF